MKALAEIQVIPLGVGVSVRGPVRRAHELIVESGLTYESHAYGTNVEGDLDEILALVRRIHETLHAEGVPRLSTAIKLGTRTDKEPTLAAKRL
ncbi:MAG: MTH1187 family thiamine-binding protein [Acidobacteriota bacterium]|nr:MAG: thiamine-binding protein [Acidobacteriota bacterium]